MCGGQGIIYLFIVPLQKAAPQTLMQKRVSTTTWQGNNGRSLASSGSFLSTYASMTASSILRGESVSTPNPRQHITRPARDESFGRRSDEPQSRHGRRKREVVESGREGAAGSDIRTNTQRENMRTVQQQQQQWQQQQPPAGKSFTNKRWEGSGGKHR